MKLTNSGAMATGLDRDLLNNGLLLLLANLNMLPNDDRVFNI